MDAVRIALWLSSFVLLSAPGQAQTLLPCLHANRERTAVDWLSVHPTTLAQQMDELAHRHDLESAALLESGDRVRGCRAAFLAYALRPSESRRSQLCECRDLFMGNLAVDSHFCPPRQKQSPPPGRESAALAEREQLDPKELGHLRAYLAKPSSTRLVQLAEIQCRVGTLQDAYFLALRAVDLEPPASLENLRAHLADLLPIGAASLLRYLPAPPPASPLVPPAPPPPPALPSLAPPPPPLSSRPLGSLRRIGPPWFIFSLGLSAQWRVLVLQPGPSGKCEERTTDSPRGPDALRPVKVTETVCQGIRSGAQPALAMTFSLFPLRAVRSPWLQGLGIRADFGYTFATESFAATASRSPEVVPLSWDGYYFSVGVQEYVNVTWASQKEFIFIPYALYTQRWERLHARDASAQAEDYGYPSVEYHYISLGDEALLPLIRNLRLRADLQLHIPLLVSEELKHPDASFGPIEFAAGGRAELGLVYSLVWRRFQLLAGIKALVEVLQVQFKKPTILPAPVVDVSIGAESTQRFAAAARTDLVAAVQASATLGF